MSGLLNCGQRPIVLGYGSSQYASHGRPVWNNGKMPAQATANKVIASANRLIDVRQVCLSRSRIAENSVPAWPMPIHQTKFVMSNAQPTGMSLPQIPIPFTVRYVNEMSRRIARLPAVRNPRYQPIDVR